jgi:hypothetical protein
MARQNIQEHAEAQGAFMSHNMTKRVIEEFDAADHA